MHSTGIPIWFFIGVLLTAYGALILGYGLYELGTGTMAVQNYHASVWWGALLLLVGLFYTIHFRPSRTS
jgi:hypothetical protein